MSDYNFPKTEKWHETLNNIIVHHNMYIYMYILMKQIKNNKHCIIVSSEFTDWKQLQNSQYDSI